MSISGVDTTGAYAFLNKNTSIEQDEKEDSDLATADYLSLMTAQLKNQDPLEPMDNGEFLGQIAQFATVSGIGDLQTSFDNFSAAMQSDQALQGSALVGRSVLVPSSIGTMTAEGGLKGQINVAEPVSDLRVQIFAESGALIKTIEMGSASGYTNFAWDGLAENGEVMTPGIYQFKASGTINGDNTAFGTATVAKVDSVLVGSGQQGLTVNLAGIGSVPFSEVQEILGV
ncbi:MAG: flagellar hook assembly protein FlgD [Piscirickettsiaceae bacterium]|nr:flagellar hook assembly protein FlgD [Piscirickettsiaceae bacterium]